MAHVQMRVEQMPDDLLARIFSFLPVNQIPSIARVCRSFNEASNSFLLWRDLYARDLGGLDPDREADEVRNWKQRYQEDLNRIKWDASYTSRIDHAQYYTISDQGKTCVKHQPGSYMLIMRSTELLRSGKNVFGLSVNHYEAGTEFHIGLVPANYGFRRFEWLYASKYYFDESHVKPGDVAIFVVDYRRGTVRMGIRGKAQYPVYTDLDEPMYVAVAMRAQHGSVTIVKAHESELDALPMSAALSHVLGDGHENEPDDPTWP